MAKRNEDCKFIIELLQLYRQHTVLWKVKNQEVPVDGSSTIILQSEDETQDLSINAEEQNIPEEQYTNAKQRPKPTI
ncbi:Hypothetical protein CINCED_3A019523 [Cinara cedri]|uniref:Uncharacterized protein n=1 Tax=Cinara cedri TaxID=506608 RepID=A0A5E4MR88_9HEMI|nr:Hypothetical protein CINCED_3A019523 [Cinara cedri]